MLPISLSPTMYYSSTYYYYILLTYYYYVLLTSRVGVPRNIYFYFERKEEKKSGTDQSRGTISNIQYPYLEGAGAFIFNY